MQVECDQPATAALAREYVLGRLPETARIQFEDHLAGCHACASRVSGMDEALAGLERQAREAPRRAPAWRGWAAAAAVVAGLVVTASLVRWQPDAGRRQDPSDPLRSADSIGVDLVAPMGGVEAPPMDLRWRSRPGQSDCSATITLADLTPIWTSEPSTAGAAAIPEEVRRALIPARRYLWKVTCGTGARQRDSSYGEFRVEPRP